MMGMTAADRVKTAFRHEKPDRIPRYEIFLPGYKAKWHEKHGSQEIFDYYSKIDIGDLLAIHEGPLTSRINADDSCGEYYTCRDSWGRLQRFSRTGTFFEVLETALPDRKGLDSLVFEDPWNGERVSAILKKKEDLAKRFCPVSGVMGLFMSSYYLRGEFDLLIDLAEDVEFSKALASRLADFLSEVGSKALELTDTYDTAIWVYDELGNNKSSIISPEAFEKIYLAPYKRMIGRWKAQGAENVVLHCDGNCLLLMDMLIDAGFTGIQGVNPSAGMTVPEVKKKYGSKLTLIGGMCNIHVLSTGTKEEIERQTRSIVEAGSDGGVIIGTHSIDEDIPIENYDYYYNLLEKFDSEH